jgi:hypothetical protein
MLRAIFVFVVALGAVALVTRSRNARRALWVVLGALAVYGVLKLTGVIDAMAPSRMGVL